MRTIDVQTLSGTERQFIANGQLGRHGAAGHHQLDAPGDRDAHRQWFHLTDVGSDAARRARLIDSMR